jgi:hypothetical protein
MALAPLALGHAQGNQQPPAVPCHRRAEAVDPARAVAQELRGGVAEVDARAPPDTLGPQPALAARARNRLACGGVAEAQQPQGAQERLLPHAAGTR